MVKHAYKTESLTLDELFLRRDEPATEQIPPRSDVQEYESFDAA